MASADIKTPPSERLVSLDALRGFDMFWITGAEGLAHGLKQIADSPSIQFARRPIELFAEQMDHVEWNGMHFEDLIFPLFVFLSGVSIPLALSRRLAKGESLAGIYGHLVKRFAILFALGIFYYGGMSHHWPDIRLVGVLPRIALCYLFAGLIYLNFRPRVQVVWLAALLLGYWALMALLPVPGHTAGQYTPDGNLAAYVDRMWLPGKAYFKELGWDPEGLLSTIPAVGSALIGVLCGQLLLNGSIKPNRKVAGLLAVGVASAALGWLWDGMFPVNKKIWTSSFVLVAGGYSCVLLGLFYLVIDVWKLRRWAMPLVIIGSNALFIYLAVRIIPFDEVAARFVGGDLAYHLGSAATLVNVLVQIALQMALLYWLYAKRIFIRI